MPPDERPSLAHLAYEAGSCWLREKEARLGCRIEGELSVTDPEFLPALLNGIGPTKTFGCGLLLVRRLG
jgi:CRISPR system Cascade subunit CasE